MISHSPSLTSKKRSALSAIFKWHSLKTRVTLTTLSFFVIGIWSLAIFTSYTLKIDMEHVLGDQQFSTVSIVAAEIDTGLSDRMRALEQVAALITPAMMGDAATMQTFLEVRPILLMMFNGGVFVLLPDGTAIADSPLSTGRYGLNFMDREYAIGALKEGKTTIGRPVMGKALRSTVFSIATPIHDPQGKVIGALNGTIDLAEHNFISKGTDNRYGKTGGYLLVSPTIRTIVYATDKTRIMEVLPAPGINPLIDRFMQGYEGTGITIRPNDGVEILTSAKGIPVSGWYVAALMPTEEAFAPINALQKRGLLAAIFLTLLAGGLTWWMLKCQLAPIFTTIKTLTARSDADQPPQPLPITRQDEIGEMIGSFNKLLETLRLREEALKESEEHYRSLVESMPGVVYTYSKKRGGVYYSSNITSLLGYSPEQLYAQPQLWHNSIHPDDLLNTEQIIRETVAGKPFYVEYRIRDAHGNWRWFEDLSFRFKVEGEDAIIDGLAFDITDRKRAEEMLREREQRLSFLLTSTPAVIYTCRTFGDFGATFVSENVQQQLGYQASEFVTDSDFWVKHIHPDDTERILAGMSALSAQDCYFHEYRFLHQDGAYRWMYDEIQTLRDAAGQPTEMIGFWLDITDRKKADEERLVLEAQFQQAQKMDSVGRLAGGVAHDYNNMLGVILGYTEICLDEVAPSEPLHQYLQLILDAAKRSADITRQLLAFARKQTIAPKVLNLDDTVESMLKMLRRLIGEDIDLAWLPSSVRKTITMDPSQMDQLLANLCVNARDAIAGVGKVTIETGMVTFDETYCAYHLGFIPGKFVLLTVSDDGCGMDKEALSNIFEPFFTTKAEGRGTGLGLATVYGIVKQNNGFINVYSEPGQGTTFSVYLPLHEDEPGAAKTEIITESIRSGHGETILIVEDEAAVLELTRTILEKINYTVLTANTPGEAMRLGMTHINQIDLLITDVVMPEMNGRDLAGKLHVLNPNIKTLFMSGYTANVIAHRGVLDKGVNFIHKPFFASELASKVREVLE